MASLLQELLCDKQLYVDGSKIEKTGFEYERPYLALSLLKEVNSKSSLVIHLFLPIGSHDNFQGKQDQKSILFMP